MNDIRPQSNFPTHLVFQSAELSRAAAAATNDQSMLDPQHDDDRMLGMLRDKKVLLVEDEVLVAMDIEYALMDAGAQVIGPATSLKSTLDLVSNGAEIDGAVLDINLNGENVFPAAAILHQRKVPFLFHTGHGLSLDLGTMFPGARLCTKPMKVCRLISELADLMSPAPFRTQ
ncbi:MAG: hypothetical protein ABJL99_18315 [Aliishimia sp.]